MVCSTHHHANHLELSMKYVRVRDALSDVTQYVMFLAGSIRFPFNNFRRF